MTTTTIDFETSIKNKGHPFTPGNIAVSYSVKVDNGQTVFKYFTDPDFVSYLRAIIKKTTLIIGFNFKFDLHWLNNLGIQLPRNCKIWDCQLGEFIITGQQVVMVSLATTLESYGLPPKDDKVAEYWKLGIDTVDIPYDVLQRYNDIDVDDTFLVFDTQQTITNDKQKKLILLEGDDLKTLAAAERAGYKFDLAECERSIINYANQVKEINDSLAKYVPALPPGCTFNWNSGDHLSALIYGGSLELEYCEESEAVYKSGPNKGDSYTKRRWFTHIQEFPRRFNPLPRTEIKKCQEPTWDKPYKYYQVDAPTLGQLKTRKAEDRQLLELLSSLAKTTKVIEMLQQYMGLIETYEWGDIIHGSYNQNVAATGRLSSSKPNAQNTPPEIDQLLISRYD